MKTTRIVAAALLLAGSLAWDAPAQLAITEVMAESWRAVGTNPKEPDYWELTNFGDIPTNLHGWSFRDNDTAKLTTHVFDQLIIGPEESVIFFRSNAVFPTVEAFKSWWGVENLPQNLQVRMWGIAVGGIEVRGLDGDSGDDVWLFDANGVLVDMVSFDKSIPGHSFTYSTESGEFGAYSVDQVNGAFRANSTTNDIGSPGLTHGHAPLSIRTHPTNQIVGRCGRAEFRVVATGIPRPRYQWMSNGIAMPNENKSTLVIPDIEPSHAADYHVVLDNGLMETNSETATLTVTTNLYTPRVFLAPEDATVFPGQTAVFHSEIHGYPCVQYQWYSDGVAIPGATGRNLPIPIPSDPVDVVTSSNRYSVTAWNEKGSTTLSAVLVVTRRPCLMITEIMTAPNNGGLFGPKNWFELTNCDTNTVDLKNYRFRDSESLDVASRITNSLFIRPGESIVFVEAMSPEQFKQWWGASRLPPDLQIVTWGGWGLSVAGVDYIHVWNPGATDPYDTVANESRRAATAGFSQLYTNDCYGTIGCAGRFLTNSVEGERGAFRAAEGGDIGSPGYAAFPRVLGISRTSFNVSVRCLVEPEKTYRLLAKDSLSEGAWTTVTTRTAGNNWVITISDLGAQTARSRFYRLEEVPSW